MNVINKIKSKKNKEVSSQQEVFKQEKKEQKKQIETQFQTKFTKNIQIESRSLSNVSETKTHFSEDLDEVNINEYYIRKDKKKQLKNRIENSQTFKDEEMRQYPFCLNIKKSHTIGDICLFQGQILHHKNGKQIYRKKVKISCSLDTIQFPQSIRKILLSNMIMLSDEEGIFVASDIIKIAEKGYKK